VCIKISNLALKELFDKQMSLENIETMKKVFMLKGSKMPLKLLTKITRLFVERKYNAGTVLVVEDKPVNSVFVIQDGICEVMSYKSPLRITAKKTF